MAPPMRAAATSTQVDGVFPGLHPGDQRSMVAAYLPAAAYNIRTPDNTYSESGADPPMQMVAQRVTVPRGESRIVTFEFSLPSYLKAALILPSGRVRPETYIVNGKTLYDAGPVIAQWGHAGKTKKGPGAPGVAGVLALAGVLVLLVGVRARLQQAAARPMRPLPDLLQQAPSLAFVLFVAALGMLVAAALIGGAT